MALIDWRPLVAAGTAPPFDGKDVLLAVPFLRTARQPGEDTPAQLHFAIYIGQWDSEDRQWCTTESSGRGPPDDLLWLAGDAPTWWAELPHPEWRGDKAILP